MISLYFVKSKFYSGRHSPIVGETSGLIIFCPSSVDVHVDENFLLTKISREYATKFQSNVEYMKLKVLNKIEYRKLAPIC